MGRAQADSGLDTVELAALSGGTMCPGCGNIGSKLRLNSEGCAKGDRDSWQVAWQANGIMRPGAAFGRSGQPPSLPLVGAKSAETLVLVPVHDEHPGVAVGIAPHACKPFCLFSQLLLLCFLDLFVEFLLHIEGICGV